MSAVTETATVDDLAWSLVRGRGSEAATFLQGQLTQDLDQIGDDHRWSLLLRPDSVVVTSLLVRGADGGVDLVVPSALVTDALTRLRRFLVRVDCVLDVVDSVEGPYANTADLVTARWPGEREFARELTPHSFGADFVAATVSFTKGCYTGQELVGRLDSRGAKVPWRVVRASGRAPDEIDLVLRSRGPDGPQGVTTAVPAPHGVVALGVAHRTLGDGDTAGVLIETL